MKDAVHQQHHKLLVQRSPGGSGLTKRLRHRNDDISQQRPTRIVRLPHCKREHIRRSILVAVESIQSTHAAIADELDA
jgi:hypothetical protein